LKIADLMVTERLPNRAAARAATLIGRVCTACRHFAQFYTKKLRKNSLGNYKSAAQSLAGTMINLNL